MPPPDYFSFFFSQLKNLSIELGLGGLWDGIKFFYKRDQGLNRKKELAVASV